MKLNLYGDYWYFNGSLNPYIVRVIELRPIKRIAGVVLVVDRKGREFTSIRNYLYKNHQINDAVNQHCLDLSEWSNNNVITQFNGASHKQDQVLMGNI